MNESAKIAPKIGEKYATTVNPWNRTEESVSDQPITWFTNRVKIAEREDFLVNQRTKASTSHAIVGETLTELCG